VALAAVPALLSLAALPWPLLAGGAFGAWLIVLALAAADLLLGRGRAVPQVRRELPRRARQGEPASARYVLRHEGREGALVSLLDELPEDLGGDRRHGPFAVAPGESELPLPLLPGLRGVRMLGPLYVQARSPLGLFARRERAGDGQALNVYPASTLSERRGPISDKLQKELGLRPRRPRGEGSEFESLREYTPDDEPRRIDWRASARARHLVVRQHHTERNHTVLIAVDCGRLMGTRIDGQSKLDHALSAAVSLARASGACQDRVGFAAFDHALCAWVSPRRPERALDAILEATLALQARPHESSYRALCEALQARQRKRALIVLLSDFVEDASAIELETYLSALARRHCVLLVGLRDRLLRELDRPAPEVAGVDVFRRLVLQDVDVAREVAIARFTRLGVHTLDLDPSAITGPLLARYLQIREAGLL
jgi:uncharacterized protein (DUF58 family)